MIDRRPMPSRFAELQVELEDLRIEQKRMSNVDRLQEVLRPHGIVVDGYDGPSFWDLGRVLQCELCGELIDATELAYELRLWSMAWGRRMDRRLFLPPDPWHL
jgi:hypothetical protein